MVEESCRGRKEEVVLCKNVQELVHNLVMLGEDDCLYIPLLAAETGLVNSSTQLVVEDLVFPMDSKPVMVVVDLMFPTDSKPVMVDFVFPVHSILVMVVAGSASRVHRIQQAVAEMIRDTAVVDLEEAEMSIRKAEVEEMCIHKAVEEMVMLVVVESML